MSTTAQVPPIFVSHGTPMLAVDRTAGADLAHWAGALPRPRGLLVISAHWQEAVLTRGSTASRPKLLYDFEGYAAVMGRRDLAEAAYPAPGAPELAYELDSLLHLDGVPSDGFERSNRGWDHGVWAPLIHMFPGADLPLLQLSLAFGASPRRLFAIGQKLGPLASRGYLIVGSGGITHNTAELDSRPDAPVAAWARAFDGWVANILADAEIDELLAWRSQGPHARRAHPTPEHLDPLFVVAGAASIYDHAVGFPVRGFEHGTLSRRCVQFGR